MSFNELFGLGSHSPDASLEGWWPLQDDAASTAVVDYSGNALDGVLGGGHNTADISSTGPNSWIAKSLDLDGTADRIVVASLPSSPDAVTVIAWADADTSGGGGFGRIVDRAYLLFMAGSATAVSWLAKITQTVTLGSSWGYVAGSYDRYSDGVHRSWLDGAIDDDGSSSGAIGDSGDLIIGDTAAGTRKFNGRLANIALFHRALADSEHAEAYAGPEPINVVAPAVSGTETVGSLLSSTSGTWWIDSPFSSGSNGTITYGYQWTRSDDGTGTNEADISGATSSSYTLVAGDLGKYIRCRVRATNDGGYDVDADTYSNFTGVIGGGGGFQPAWAARRSSRIIGSGLGA